MASPPPTDVVDDPTIDQENLSGSSGVPFHGKKISLNILHTVKTSQMQFGLRHADYQRYRKYCSRRLTRIRKSLKFTHQTGAKGNTPFQKKPVEPHMVTDERYFLLVLFRCERAWAYSMQLKQDRDIQTNNTRLVHHQLRRLDKAALYAQALEKISPRADEHTALDVTAYAGYMQGIVALERESWEIALTHLAKASTIYSKLGVVSGTETNQLCKEKVEEIDVRIRFCLRELRKAKGQGAATEIKDEETKDLIAKYLKGNEELTSKLESVMSDKAKKPTDDNAHEVSWKGQRISIQNEKLRALIVNAQKQIQDLDTSSSLETQLPIFEQLFAAYSDATKLIKEEITTIQKSNVGKGKAKDPQEQSLSLLQEYVTYLKQVASVHRSVILADSAHTVAITDVAPVSTAAKKKHPDEMVRLYDNVLHGMSEIETLLHGTVQDPEEIKVTAAKLVLYKASRCYWLAQSFAAVGSTDKAVALFDRADQHAAQAAQEFAAASRASKADRERRERLEKDIATGRAKSRAKAFLASLSPSPPPPTESSTKPTTTKESVSQGKSLSLAAGLSTFDSSFLAEKHLTDFPPNLEAIPCKPLLFDLALNDCTFPNLESRKKAASQKSGGGGGGGWGGFFGFGRS